MTSDLLWSHPHGALHAPTISAHGLPVAHDHTMEDVRDLDFRLFALYFLITETLTTYIGYRITQHCLRGRGLYMLSPTVRTWIVILYCAVKIRVIDYAFHGSLYLIVTMITAFCFTMCTLVAIIFHFGPMQFVFADFRHTKKPSSATQASLVAHACDELKHFLLKQHFHEYARELAAARHVDDRMPGPVCSTVAMTPVPRVRVPLLIGSVQLQVPKWNDWFIKHTAYSVTRAASTKAKPSLLAETMTESRFPVLMHMSGLVLDIILAKTPTPSLMLRLHHDEVYPFELVVRLVRGDSGHHSAYFFYAESPKLVGSSTALIKRAIFAILVQLNATAGHPVDVLLRSLRCKDFMDAECHREVAFKRMRPRSASLSSRLESTFG